MKFTDFTVKDAAGEEVSLSRYQGKVVLVVNTATLCGLTPQYPGLQALYEKYRDRGFEILDFPCNQFGNQAPGSDEEIHKFCSGRFGITFPQFGKIDVNGPNEDPLYNWLKTQKQGMGGRAIKWNFTKFLLDRDGKVVGRYAPTKTPEALDEAVGKLVGA
jgi:glutathione peroxidase